MSLERIIKALIGLGLSRVDAEVYVYLAKKGSMKANALANSLNYSRNKIYSALRNLTKEDLVTKEGTIYSALPFEEALELLIQREKEKAEYMNQRKKELLVKWKKEE